MSKNVVILGGGFGGLELATRLSEALADEINITLIDQSDHFTFGFSKLDVMFGLKEPDDVRLYYRDVVKPGVVFTQEHVRSIDPTTRRVITDAATYDADVLVVALGADLDPAATPGLTEAGHEFYSSEGAAAARTALDEIDSGVVLIGVLGPFFKCPPAPFEAAMMLHEYLNERGVADAVSIKVVSPMPSPVPISKEVSQGILEGLAVRGIDFLPETEIERIDPDDRAAVLRDGSRIDFDLFLGVPVHRAPKVVEGSPLAVDGWIPVDTSTFATSFPGVYAIGDVTSAPVPRAGVFAEGEAATLADHLIAQERGEGSSTPYGGVATCYVEFGGGPVGKVNVDFLTGPTPKGTFQSPSLDFRKEKAEFEADRRRRWFAR
jgi:sulfide:quinone oxidoreductase